MNSVFENIIEKLEEQKSGLTEWAEDEAFKLATDNAIEIVKQGGVSDDVCEWTQTSTAKYKTECGYKLEEYFDTKACYCKQCGKKIKIV